MADSVSLAGLRERHINLRPHEAVAVAQELIRAVTNDPQPAVDHQAPPGPPSLETVQLTAGGAVLCVTCASVPAVSEIAILLDALVPHGTPHVPGGLRYAIARALLEVDAPPFDSVGDFSRALVRFEQGDRHTVLRQMAHRAGLVETRPPIVLLPALAPPDRRGSVIVTSREASHGKRIPAIAAGLFVGLSLVGVGEAMHMRHAPPAVVAGHASPPAEPAVALSPAVPETPAAVAPLASPAAPAPHARRHRAVKMARADVPMRAGGPSSHVRRARDTDRGGLLGRLKLNWIKGVFTHRN